MSVPTDLPPLPSTIRGDILLAWLNGLIARLNAIGGVPMDPLPEDALWSQAGPWLDALEDRLVRIERLSPELADVLHAYQADVEATDIAVGALVGDDLTLTRAALRAGFLSRDQAPASVAMDGAVGDGVTDDGAAINAAIARGRPIQLIPGAVHVTSQPIDPGDVPIYGNDATLRVVANVDALIVGPRTKARDLDIVIDHPGYDKIGIAFDGTAGFNVLATTELHNITLTGPGVSSGTLIGCVDGGTIRKVVTYVKARGIRGHNWLYGVRLSATKSDSWMNGNDLDVSMYNVARMVTLEGTTDSNTISGQLQFSGGTQYGVKTNGHGNRFYTMLWDYAAYPSALTHDFTGGSYNKAITDDVAVRERLVGANPTNEVNFTSRLGMVLPKVRDRAQFSTRSSTLYAYENYVGTQDDIFKMAHRNYAVTSTVAPSSGALERAFNFGPLPVAWALSAGQSCTVTVDATAAPLVALHIIGVLFANNDRPDYVKIETETTGGAVTKQFEVGSTTTAGLVADPLQHTRNLIGGTVAKVHITFSVVAAKTVRVGSIFASSGQVTQKSFLTTDGGKTYGNVEFGLSSVGPVLTAPSGARYRMGVDNSGNPTFTAL